MDYAINHVHIRAKDPKESAAWYEKIFNAKIVSEREVMPGTITIGMQVGGPTRLNISSQPPNSSLERAIPELNRLGQIGRAARRERGEIEGGAGT